MVPAIYCKKPFVFSKIKVTPYSETIGGTNLDAWLAAAQHFFA
jgi:hypothetical protein